MEPHADGRPTYDGVRPGSPRGSLRHCYLYPSDRTITKQVCQLQTGDIWSTLKRNAQTLYNPNQPYLRYSQHILQFLQTCHEAIQTLHAVELQGTLVSEILVEWSERKQTVSLVVSRYRTYRGRCSLEGRSSNLGQGLEVKGPCSSNNSPC